MKTIPLLLFTLLISACVSQPKLLESGELKPCPMFPGCAEVIWHTNGEEADAWKAIVDYLAAQSNISIVEQTDSYLQAEASTPTMGFIDDIQFFRRGNGTIAARSASRLGISDLGVNKARLNSISNALVQIKRK
jgi:uncharacterized protein (DUF1499 family)